MEGMVRRRAAFGLPAAARLSAFALAFLCLAAVSFAEPEIPEGFWTSLLLVRDGVSDFPGKSVGSFFRNVSFHELVLPSGASTTFSIEPLSFDGKEVILRYSILTNGVKTETFDFHFTWRGTTSLLYRLSRGEAKIEGFEQMKRIMKEFYLPSLSLH